MLTQQFQKDNLVVHHKSYVRYCKLIQHYITNPVSQGEKHHILPVSLFPSYKKDTNNIVVLPNRVHYLVHFLLMKFTRHKSMIYAFNQMNRVAKNSVLYDSFRSLLSQTISENNKGKVMYNDGTSNIMLDKNIDIDVYNKTNNVSYVKGSVHESKMRRKLIAIDSQGDKVVISSEEYSSGNFKTHISGRKSTQETKDKISESRVDRLYYNNGVNNIFIKKDDIPPIGYVLGFVSNEKMGIHSKDTVYINDGKNTLRIHKDADIPDGFVKGRVEFNNKGFEKVNSDDYINAVYDIYKCESLGKLIHKDDFDITPNYIYCPMNPDDKKFYIFNGIIFFRVGDYEEYMNRHNFCLIGESVLKKGVVPKPVGKFIKNNKNKTNYNDIKSNVGMKISDIGYHYDRLKNIKYYNDIIQQIYKEGTLYEYNRFNG